MNNFNRDFARARKWGIFSGVASFIISAGLIGFGIWVVIMVMKHFGIL